jgi:hypothetical protein
MCDGPPKSALHPQANVLWSPPAVRRCRAPQGDGVIGRRQCIALLRGAAATISILFVQAVARLAVGVIE